MVIELGLSDKRIEAERRGQCIQAHAAKVKSAAQRRSVEVAQADAIPCSGPTCLLGRRTAAPPTTRRATDAAFRADGGRLGPALAHAAPMREPGGRRMDRNDLGAFNCWCRTVGG